MAVRAMKNGAVEFLSKPFNNQVLLETVQSIIERNKKSQQTFIERQQVMTKLQQLTRRELEVLKLVVAGKLSKAIAMELGISTHTVELHRTKIMKKLAVRSLGQLINVILSNAIKLD